MLFRCLAAAAAAAAAAALLSLRLRSRLPPRGAAQPALTADVPTLRRLLSLILDEILPKTRAGVAAGNKVFGAAVLDGEYRTLVAETNHETACPLYHGEVYAIEQWAALEGKPPASASIFVATHEPCCLCISAIVWSGFRKCFFLYPYETTRDQGIPHDLRIMYELWQVERYAMRNEFCATAGILPLIEALPEGEEKEELKETVRRINAEYDALSRKYHSEKAANPKNQLAFN
ncbi:hypothetical protein AB1Y20_010293 [Prymnesium parvum]|uniref:CMP/dCMP-type deaminase domain-containing protein n=1 Tax=Prymnesium parvum TaxID=97485 RepID=A0AB34K6R4_PRYPA